MRPTQNADILPTDGEYIDQPDYETAGQIAKRLAVGAATVRNWARDGKIPALKMGHKTYRYQFADVIEALRSNAK